MPFLTEQRIYWLLIAVLFAYLFNILSPILSPFIFSALLAYLGDPVVDRLEQKMSRTLAVVSVFTFIIIVLLLTVMIFIPLVSDQLTRLLGKVPAVVSFYQEKMVPFLEKKFEYDAGTNQQVIVDAVKVSLSDLPNLAHRVFSWLTGSGQLILTFFTNLLLIPVVTFYLLRDWDILVEKAHALLPRKTEPKIVQITVESNTMLSAFLRGQFLVMNALGLVYSIGLSMIGLESAILVGFIAGWLSFVPYLGLILGFVVATAMAYFQFGDILHPFGVIVVFVIGQTLEMSFLTPKFVGERIGLHPVAVIFAVLAGAQLAGFSGMLLALPIAAVVNVLISHAHSAYQSSTLYDNAKKNGKKRTPSSK